MSDTTFSSGTIIASSWLNDVNRLTYDLPSTASGKGASLIGVQDAAGNFPTDNVEAALQSLATRFYGVNVTSPPYNADKTGATSASSAIQAAIDSLPTPPASVFGGVVFIPRGLYKLGAKITVPNGVMLVGEGPSATQLFAASTFNDTALVTNSDHTGVQEYFYIRDMLLDGAKGSGAVCSVAVLDIDGVFVPSGVKNVVTINGSKYGLHVGSTNGAGPITIEDFWSISNGDHNILLDAQATSSTAASQYNLHRVTSEHQPSGKSGIYIQGNGKLYSVNITDCHFEQSNTGAGTQCITIDGCPDVKIDGIQVQSASATSGGVKILANAATVRYSLKNVTNINGIIPIIDDLQAGVTWTVANHVPWYCSAEVGLYDNRTQTLTYGATINTDLTQGNYCKIVITNATAFTVAAPTNARVGQLLTYEITNATAGAAGAITWNAAFLYRDASYAQPAAGKRRTITFEFRGGGVWAQIGAATGDM